MAEGLTKAISMSPLATAWAMTAEPLDSRSHGLNSAPDPLPTVMHTSRLPPYFVSGFPAMWSPSSQRILARLKLAPLGRGSMIVSFLVIHSSWSALPGAQHHEPVERQRALSRRQREQRVHVDA